MALRRIDVQPRIFSDDCVYEVRVYRDAEWNEYRARLYINGALEAGADAHDTDKGAIIDTARAMVSTFND